DYYCQTWTTGIHDVF
nr:immunoglobulin light chain junction region [Macaca mulatta]MOW56578.1 immunoglobulin light chain junction region [Macaca mulatta]MOW56934.1 immunoglobulin light chain junction region [Macaca mulatta]MOW57196.1 immunoglobulin light chain junction region [Macaca mulatta]MOW57259.1 immunoglobulin light chain junction region [Macaca mulatta]